MNFFLFTFITIIFLSCSNINREQREYYESKHPKLRHGVIPLSSSIKSKSPLIEKLDQASIDRGRALYVKNCLSCHGDLGRGDGPAAIKQKQRPADLQKTAREVDDFKFFMTISQWQGDMPGWQEPFTEAQREDLAVYIKSLR
jgi:mono/diheme cytochrome c family protein